MTRLWVKQFAQRFNDLLLEVFIFMYLQDLLSGVSKPRYFPLPHPILTHTEKEGNANIYKKHRAFMVLPPWFSSYVRSLAINKKWLCVSCYCYSTRGQESCMCSLAFSQTYRTVMESLFSLAAYTSDYRWQRPTRLDQHFCTTQKVTCEGRKAVLN